MKVKEILRKIGLPFLLSGAVVYLVINTFNLQTSNAQQTNSLNLKSVFPIFYLKDNQTWEKQDINTAAVVVLPYPAILSPDKKQLAYTVKEGGNWDSNSNIYIYDLAAQKTVMQIPINLTGEFYVTSWSPNNSTITVEVIAQYYGGNVTYVFDLNTKVLIKVGNSLVDRPFWLDNDNIIVSLVADNCVNKSPCASIQKWNLETGDVQELKQLPLINNSLPVISSEGVDKINNTFNFSYQDENNHKQISSLNLDSSNLGKAGPISKMFSTVKGRFNNLDHTLVVKGNNHRVSAVKTSPLEMENQQGKSLIVLVSFNNDAPTILDYGSFLQW
jgi:hypothetical protein